MHKSAMVHGQAFFETYCSGDFSGKTIVDVGSQDVNGSLRDFRPSNANYIGLDFVDGRGVDVIITDPYQLPLENESVDVIVCSSVFEHCDFFWILFLECLRVLKPSGLIYLNTPSNGMIHRYPIDSWRMYPDSGLSLEKWAHRNNYSTSLLESFVSNKIGCIHNDGLWNDFVAVFVKDGKYSAAHPIRMLDKMESALHGYASNKETVQAGFSHTPDYELIIEQKKEIDYLSKTVYGKNCDLELISKELYEILNSNSWHLTRPMRTAKEQIMSFTTKVSHLVIKALRVIWRTLPLSSNLKTFLKIRLLKSNLGSENNPNIPVIKFDFTHEGYTEQKSNPPIDPIVKLIAFYLPQFHPFPENDAWWGKGFTEWYNVGRAKQNYTGHYQPHCPIHNGYYDLRVPSVMEEQAALAKQYGIHGFSYYFYWFGGKVLMDGPLEMMLNNPKIDLPFCLTWANENWTRRWDGQEHDVLIAQDHSNEDSLAFITHLLKYFHDPRYIRIDGKPVLVIYRANIIPDIKQIASLWRSEVARHGIPDLYLICAQSFGIKGPEDFGFDASVEFPPHTTKSYEISSQVNVTNPEFNGRIFSYDQVVAASIKEEEPTYKLFRTPMLSWDNTARKQNDSHCFHGFSLTAYKQWLSVACSNVFRSDKYLPEEKLVFINAWNEWAEGTHLEPDRKYGYGYLQATYDVMSNYDRSAVRTPKMNLPVKRNNYAVMLHIHYPELWPELKIKILNLLHVGVDLFVSTTTQQSLNDIAHDFPEAYIELHENRGRDVFPFTKFISILNENKYRAVCKLHSKMSAYREDGNSIRSQLLHSLIGTKDIVSDITRRFDSDSALGMLVPDQFLIQHNDINMKYNFNNVTTACARVGFKFKPDVFPAGSMFWFKPEALNALGKFSSSDFDIERGLADGTMPHAIERIFCLVATQAGFKVETC